MELLFKGQKEIAVELPEGVQNIQNLLAHVRDHVLQERPELFMQGDTMYILFMRSIMNIDMVDVRVC